MGLLYEYVYYLFELQPSQTKERISTVLQL